MSHELVGTRVKFTVGDTPYADYEVIGMEEGLMKLRQSNNHAPIWVSISLISVLEVMEKAHTVSKFATVSDSDWASGKQ